MLLDPWIDRCLDSIHLFKMPSNDSISFLLRFLDPWILGSLDSKFSFYEFWNNSLHFFCLGPWIPRCLDSINLFLKGFPIIYLFCLDSWILGFLETWILGSLDSWILGFLDPWILNSLFKIFQKTLYISFARILGSLYP